MCIYKIGKINNNIIRIISLILLITLLILLISISIKSDFSDIDIDKYSKFVFFSVSGVFLTSIIHKHYTKIYKKIKRKEV